MIFNWLSDVLNVLMKKQEINIQDKTSVLHLTSSIMSMYIRKTNVVKNDFQGVAGNIINKRFIRYQNIVIFQEYAST